MQLVSSGHTAVSVNGVFSPSFANGQGLRQGDPISPLSFNFVPDVLSCILDRASVTCHISHVISDLTPSRVSHLQYADDTILLIENNDLCIANLKFVLLCFESLSGLKINLSKSEALVLGCSKEEAKRVSYLLNFKLATFPFNYLGILLYPSKIFMKYFAHTVLKVGNRVMP